VRRVAGVSGRCGQVGGASGCRPLGLGRRCVWLQAVGVRWEVLQDEHGGGSGGRYVGLREAGVRWDVRRDGGGVGQAGGTGVRGSGLRCVGL
jgi:hypothetical protein